MDTAPSHASADPQAGSVAANETDGRRPIGEIYVELGFITRQQLEAAMEVQREKGGRIGEILVEQGSLTRLDLASALAEHWEPQRFAPPTTRRDDARGEELLYLAEHDHAAIGELEERLRAVEERLGSVQDVPASPRGFFIRTRAVTDMQVRLAQVEQGVGSLAGLNVKITSLERSLEQLERRRESDAAATSARVDAAHAEVEKRLEAVEDRHGLIAELEEAFDALGLRLRALEASVAELADRLRAHEDEASGSTEALEALRCDVDTGRAGSEREISSLKLEAGSLGARVDELRGLRSADSQELRRSGEQLSSRLDELAGRLDVLNAAHEEHVLATQRALLEEVSALRSMVEALEEQPGGKKAKKGKKRKHDDTPS
jgi:DNA repair exonuclease SbcCD ATPase subunit